MEDLEIEMPPRGNQEVLKELLSKLLGEILVFQELCSSRPFRLGKEAKQLQQLGQECEKRRHKAREVSSGQH